MACKALQLSGWIDSDSIIDSSGDEYVAGQPAVLSADGWQLATSPAAVLGVFKNDMRDDRAAAFQAADAGVSSSRTGAVVMGLNKLTLTRGKLANGTYRTPFALPPASGAWGLNDHLYVGATGLWDNQPAASDDPPFGIVTVAPTLATDSLEAVVSSLAGFQGGADLAAGPQLIDTDGATAISLTTRTTRADGNAAGDDITSTLADGLYDGQRKSLVMADITAAKTWVITPTNFADGTTITLDTALDGAELEWSEELGAWFAVALTGNAAVA